MTAQIMILFEGQCCIVCGAAACTSTKCIRNVDRKVTCKTVSRSKSVEEAIIKVAGERKHRFEKIVLIKIHEEISLVKMFNPNLKTSHTT